MKKILLFSAVALLVLFAGCQLPQTGSVQVSLQGLSRTITGNSGKGDTVRLQLVRNNKIVTLGGAEYLEQGLAGQTITIDGLTPGSGYSLAVVTGEKRPSGYLEVAYYKNSDPFEISSGVDTAVSIDISKNGDLSKFQLVEAEPKSVHSATQAEGSVYYLKGTDVLNIATGETIASVAGLSTLTLNGLAYHSGDHLLWANTSGGIAIQSGTGFNPPEMTGSNGVALRPAVVSSGFFQLYDAAAGKTNTISYYAGAGLVGGVKVNTSTKWSTFESLMGAISSTKDLLNGDVVRGFAATNRFLFLSTPIGLFRISSDLIGQDADKLGKNLTNGKDAQNASIVVAPANNSLVIGSVSAYSDASESFVGSKAFVFGATYKGLFGGAVNSESGVPEGSKDTGTATEYIAPLPLISGTSGQEITQVSTSPVANAGTVYTAAYSATTRSLLILENLEVKRTVSGFAGLPAGSPRFSWYTAGSAEKTLYLVVTGQDATVQYPVARW